MNKESTKKFLLAMTLLWSASFLPSIALIILVVITTGLITYTDQHDAWIPGVCIILAALFPIWLFKIVSSAWSCYKEGKFKQAILLSLLPAGYMTAVFITYYLIGHYYGLFNACNKILDVYSNGKINLPEVLQ